MNFYTLKLSLNKDHTVSVVIYKSPPVKKGKTINISALLTRVVTFGLGLNTQRVYYFKNSGLLSTKELEDHLATKAMEVMNQVIDVFKERS